MIQTFTADGNYTLSPTTNGTAVYVSGDFGTATAYLAYQNQAGDFLPVAGGHLFNGFQNPVYHGIDVEVFVIVTGANGSTSIEVQSVAA